MSSQAIEIVVEYAVHRTTRQCSPTPSTSSSSISSTENSGADTPTSSGSSKHCRSRRFSKTKKSTANSLRRSSRKMLIVGKKYAKRFTSSTASKLRLAKYKVDKQYQRLIAESKARVEKLHREREELISGNSSVAILCEEVTSDARSLREQYERQRPVFYHAVLSAFYGPEDFDEEEDEGHIGLYGEYSY